MKKQDYMKRKSVNVNKKGNRKDKVTKAEEVAAKPFNDPVWYFKYPELMQAAARVPFVKRPGTIIKDAFNSNYEGTATVQPIEVPGVLTMQFVPTIGKSNKNIDPASLTAKELYSSVRSQFSSALNADAPDMLIQVMALDSIYAYIAAIKRMYRVLNSVSVDNYVMPNGLLVAMGIKEELIPLLQANKSNLYGTINTLVRMCQKFICPAAFPVMDRHYWMCDNVFMDAPSQAGQMYLFMPHGFNKFALVQNPQGELSGGLEYTPWDLANQTADTIVNYIYSFGADLIESLSAWESAYDINGYFTKAFGDNKFIISEIGLMDTVDAKYSTEVLMQIQNSTSVPVATGATTTYIVDNQVSQDPLTNAVICNPKLTVTTLSNVETASATGGGIINIPLGVSPSPELVVEATRLKSLYTIETGISRSEPNVFDVNCATEFIVRKDLTLPNANPASSTDQWTTQYISGLIVADFTTDFYYAGGSLLHSIRATWFNDFPMTPIMIVDTTPDGTRTAVEYFGDIQNLGQMSISDFEDINRVALLSQLNSFTV